jgi:hypothetical protein
MLPQVPQLHLEKRVPEKPVLQTATQLLPCAVRLQKSGRTPFAGSSTVGSPEHAAASSTVEETNGLFDAAETQL